MINTVFLDMDGVFVNFRKGIYQAFNKPYSYATDLMTKWDFWEEWGTTSEGCNAICTTSFWQNLEWMHDGLDIFREALKYFNPEQIYLLTCPMSNAESATGKLFWIKNNLPDYCRRTIISKAPKALLAKPNCLLIDDKDENVEEFIAAGGDAILVPRPWNKLHKDKDCAWFTVATELVKRMDGCKLL